jgi:hypothetical protein
MEFQEKLIKEYEDLVLPIKYNEKCLKKLHMGRLKLSKLSEDDLNAYKHDPRYYEEIGCIGYNPRERMLEAVINIKRPYGYGGGCKSHGSAEYVQFCFDRTGDGDFSD